VSDPYETKGKITALYIEKNQISVHIK